MLAELRILDFAIIDELQLRFPPGFSVMTGETGAGKSIIVDAVALVLGGRASASVVRAGTDYAIIEAVFRLGPKPRAAIDVLLEREGLEADDPELLLLGREVRVNGRNVCRVNGRAVTLALLREVAEGLVDIHGQSEHLSLMRVHQHVNLLDRYAGLWSLRMEVAELVGQVRSVRKEVTDFVQREQELAHRVDLLEFQIGEIQSAALQPREEEQLVGDKLRLGNVEQLVALVGTTLRALEGEQGQTPAALDLLGAALRSLENLIRIDPALEPRLRSAESASYLVEELINGLRAYRDRLEYNPQRLEEVQDRLALIRRLERKYGPAIPDVLVYAEDAVRELDAITHSEERIAELQQQEEDLLREAGKMAVELSRQRREAAQRLAAGIEAELAELAMEGARFEVGFKWRDDPEGIPLNESQMANCDLERWTAGLRSSRVAFDASGVDIVEFLVSANPGEPVKPLIRVASGGEASRLMLALKTVLSRADETPTLIFDEIDQGIGGRVGATVGEKLWGISAGTGPDGQRHQALCVTHLPQLAGFGEVHFHVEKHLEDERTITRVRQLQGPERVAELAQMLGASGEAAYRSAEEILEHIAERKLAAARSID